MSEQEYFPDCAAIYFIWGSGCGEAGKIFYIGKADNLYVRWHFGGRKDGHPKPKEIAEKGYDLKTLKVAWLAKSAVDWTEIKQKLPWPERETSVFTSDLEILERILIWYLKPPFNTRIVKPGRNWKGSEA